MRPTWISSISNRFRTRTVRTRLLASFTILLGAISFFIYFFFPNAIEQEALRGIESKAESIGSMAAHSVGSAVLFEDRASMEEALRGALKNDEVTFVEVVNLEGEVLALLRSDRNARGRQESGYVEQGELFSFSAPVVAAGTPVGEVRMELSLEGMKAQVARARGLVGLVSLAVFGIGLVVAVLFSAHVTAPMREMADAAERIASGDFQSRARWSTEDEVGQMARSFNRMVDRLQSAHEDLAVSKHQLEQVLDNIPADVVMYDLDGRYLYANPAAIPDEEERLWVLSKNPVDYARRAGLEEDGGRDAINAVKKCAQERRLITTEQINSTIDGQETQFVRFFSPILNGTGEVIRVIAYGLDLTDLRKAESELRETQERLLQAQKMESVGRLAGGIAHDFNNLLTTISGNVDLLLLSTDERDPVRDGIKEIRKAADGAAGLTRQLLAFSRKQVTQPRVLDLNDTVIGIQKMLRRLIGEDLAFSIDLADDPGSIKADPGQIEQVLVNLVVNARDAMPKGGSITIKTSSMVSEEEIRGHSDETIPAGAYVTISVSDTGIGMDDQTKDRIFEPFFTRKDPGKGTGLGLATVYGILKQSGAFILVSSEEGLGTTFQIFFPKIDRAAEPVSAPRKRSLLPAGTERILVTEDQDGVRKLAIQILESCGYDTLSAASPQEALELVENCPYPIHLVLTDVVMPGMSGPDLVASLAPKLPGIPVIYMSGYMDDQLQNHGVLDDGVILIEKPFTALSLAATVRSALDDPKGVGAIPGFARENTA